MTIYEINLVFSSAEEASRALMNLARKPHKIVEAILPVSHTESIWFRTTDVDPDLIESFRLGTELTGVAAISISEKAASV